MAPNANANSASTMLDGSGTETTVTEKVLVKQASEKIEVVPAKYEWVEEKVLVKEASKELKVVPAVYETTTERVLVKNARQVWKSSSGRSSR